MKLKNAKFIPLITTLLSVVSCSSGAKPQVLAVGGNIELLDGIKLDYKNAFFDDFTNGVSKDNWYIGKQAWGGSNGGVIPENINYTDDGVLVITVMVVTMMQVMSKVSVMSKMVDTLAVL